MKILSTNNLLPSGTAFLSAKSSSKPKVSLDEQITKVKEELKQVTGAMNSEKEVLDELWSEYSATQNKQEKDAIIHIIDCYEEPVFLRNRLRKLDLEEKLQGLIQHKNSLTRQITSRIKF